MSAEMLASMARKPTITAATYPRFLNSAGETKGCATPLIRNTKSVAEIAEPRKLPQEENEPKPVS